MKISTDIFIPPIVPDRTHSVRLQFEFDDKSNELTIGEFWNFCSQNDKLQIELVKKNEIKITFPRGFEFSQKSLEILMQLGSWEKTYQTGKCRDYSLDIKANGNVSLKLEETRKRKAKNINTKIKPQQIKQLLKSFEKANFFQLQDEYTNGDICKIRATDQSTEIISIQINGKKKSIEHYLGCYIDEREIITSLLNLGNKIDEIVRTKRWVRKQ